MTSSDIYIYIHIYISRITWLLVHTLPSLFTDGAAQMMIFLVLTSNRKFSEKLAVFNLRIPEISSRGIYLLYNSNELD